MRIGFADEHINGILRQSLNRDKDRKLLAVTFAQGSAEEQAQTCATRVCEIVYTLNLRHENQVVCWGCGAKKFLTEELTIDNLAELFPEQESLFEEVGS